MTIEERAKKLYQAHVCRKCGYTAKAEMLEDEVKKADEACREALDRQAGLI